MRTIKEITAAETYPVRHPVLRAGKPVESCRFEGDDKIGTKHFGVFDENELVGVASLFESASDLFDVGNQFQLRGMAVLERCQKKGFGVDLVKHAEAYARDNGGKIIWFNARIIAVPFYEKLGYRILGEPFDIADVGEHYVMYKEF
ncbi:MAG TPA: GNAT family N-acetyltransferase [Flavobacterium sp.]|nr:GNAT family N-acetyltransferase [Flavobacterium sp.]